MTEYVTFAGERIIVTSIVECMVLTAPMQHRGWGIVEALYPANDMFPARARVRDIDRKVRLYPLQWLRLSRKVPQPETGDGSEE